MLCCCFYDVMLLFVGVFGGCFPPVPPLPPLRPLRGLPGGKTIACKLWWVYRAWVLKGEVVQWGSWFRGVFPWVFSSSRLGRGAVARPRFAAECASASASVPCRSVPCLLARLLARLVFSSSRLGRGAVARPRFAAECASASASVPCRSVPCLQARLLARLVSVCTSLCVRRGASAALYIYIYVVAPRWAAAGKTRKNTKSPSTYPTLCPACRDSASDV